MQQDRLVTQEIVGCGTGNRTSMSTTSILRCPVSGFLCSVKRSHISALFPRCLESMHRVIHAQASPVVDCSFKGHGCVSIFHFNFSDGMFNALRDFWAFSACVEQPGFILPKTAYSLDQRGWFLPKFACYNHVDHTEERIAIDHRCSPEQTTTFLQGLEDARLLTTNALKWPHNEYGVDAMDMYMGKDAHGNKTFVDYTQGVLSRISLNLDLPDSPKFLVLDCAEHWYPDETCTPNTRVGEDTNRASVCYASGHKEIEYATSQPNRKWESAAVDFICCFPIFFDTSPDIAEIDRITIRTKLAEPPCIQHLNTVGQTLLHEMLHTRLITDNHIAIDVVVQDCKM